MERVVAAFDISKDSIVFSGKVAARSSATGVTPNYLVPEIRIPKNLVHLHLDVVAGVPVAMHVNGPGGLEYALHLNQTGIEPDEITVQAALPNIVERAQFVVVAPNHVVLSSGEEGRVYVDEVHAVGRYLAHDVEVVAPDEAVRLMGGGHAESDALGYLRGQADAGVVALKAALSVPALRLGFDRNVPETRGGAVKLFLSGQAFRDCVVVGVGLMLRHAGFSKLSRAAWGGVWGLSYVMLR